MRGATGAKAATATTASCVAETTWRTWSSPPSWRCGRRSTPARSSTSAEGRGPVSAGDGLRGFLARLVGWTNERAIDLAVRSVELAADHRAALVLHGVED